MSTVYDKTLMEQVTAESVASVMDGLLTVESSDESGEEWVLRDKNTDAEFAVWPEEVPSLIALLRGFRRSAVESGYPLPEQDDHDCTEHTISHDVDGLDAPITECAVCGQMST